MGYYTKEHTFYCGIDLHAASMFLSVCDASGKTLLHKDMKSSPELLERHLEPYMEDLVVACECVFAWYWLADWCEDNGVTFVLGHALAMSAIYKAKVKDDSRDAEQIARLLRTGFLPMAYVYERKMRATRDLMRRRMTLVHMQTQFLNHTQTLSLVYKRQRTEKKMCYPANRREAALFTDDPITQLSYNVNSKMLDAIQIEKKRIERTMRSQALKDAPQEIHRLKSIPGIGDILSLTILYEIHTIDRFPTVGQFISYCRLITPEHQSAGKKVSQGNRKIGNKYLRWAFGEAAVIMLRENKSVRQWHERMVNKKGKSKALSILAAKIARTVYYLLKNKQVFEAKRFLGMA